MNRYRIIGAISIGFTLALTGLATSVSPASADSNGHCYVYKESPTSVWGWCDGTGPQRYQILSLCQDGAEYPSVATPWYGDRNGAWTGCPSSDPVVGGFGVPVNFS
jgi:hypothetical protein